MTGTEGGGVQDQVNRSADRFRRPFRRRRVCRDPAESTAVSAARVAEKLCRQIRESRFLLDGEEVRTSLSIGVAQALPGESEKDLLKRADLALYRVKQGGRNGLAVAEGPKEGPAAV